MIGQCLGCVRGVSKDLGMVVNKYKSFGELRLSAVESFVRTAILIDNEPVAGMASQVAEQPLVARSAAYGVAGVTSDEIDEQPPIVEPERTAGHHLSVLPVTNAFASRRITCGFYFPANDDDQVVPTALAAARHVDATIVDWQLRPNDTAPAKDLITELLKDDMSAGGRLRLIVVYTGERGIDAECGKLAGHLAAAGIEGLSLADEGRALAGKNSLITFANKPQALEAALPELAGPGARPIPWDELPKFVLEQFASLAKGLLQSFALKAIAAVRDDTHHLLSVFNSQLDGAYLAQRAGVESPSNAEEMMTSLLTSEFACSILDRGISADVLGEHGAVHALKVRPDPSTIKVKKYDPEPLYQDIVHIPANGGRSIKADVGTLTRLLKVGLDTNVIELRGDERKSLDRQFFPDDTVAQQSLSRFARMTSYSREIENERRVSSKALHLTGGVIVRFADRGRETLLLCVQPGCDAVRLTGETAFPFCPLIPSTTTFDLILHVDGKDRYFKIDRTPRSLIMLKFSPNKARKIVVPAPKRKKVGFISSSDKKFWEFLAELRPPENQHFTTLLVGKFNRVALNGSEWLRLHGAG
jgi:hypothetical protein